MASLSSKVNEANKLLENGHKFMKTSLLKWAPDHDNAANQYQQAAMAFKGAGVHQKAIEAFELAIKCYMTSQSSAFQAAKCMEQAALSSKEIGDIQNTSKFYMRAIDVYRSLGQVDTAVSTMERAAKALTEKMPTMAADIYIQASEACVLEDRYRQAAEYCNKAATLYLKAKEYQRAANIAREEINCYNQAGDTRTRNRTGVGLILIHLANKNPTGAQEVLRTCQMDDDVYYMAQDLVTGFDKHDSKLVSGALNNSFFKNLDTEFAKLARELLNTYGKPPPSSTGAATTEEEAKAAEAPDDLL